MRSPVAALLLVLAAPAAGSAQVSEERGVDSVRDLSALQVEVWTEEDGLPQNMASSLAWTPDGYLWLGTEQGLVRFDGLSFTVFGPSNEPAFTVPWVRSLWADPDGTLWVGTNGGGLVRMRQGRFTTFTTADGLPGTDLRAVFRDRDGTLWIGTNGGGVVRRVGDRFETIDTESGLSNDFVLALGQSRDGAIWVGTRDGLNRIDGDRVRIFREADGLPGAQVTAVEGVQDGSVWIGTNDGGLARYHEGTFSRYSSAEGLSSDYVTALYEDPAGSLWIATNGGGVNRLRDGELSSLGAGAGFPGDLVLSIAGGPSGGVWAGVTGAGLVRIWDGAFRTLGRPEGLTADIALALLEDDRGDLWVGTAGGGVNRIADGEVRGFTSADGLGHDIVLSLAEGEDGDIWVGTAAGGLSRIRNGTVRTFGPGDGLVSTQTTAIAPDGTGGLWLGTAGSGLQRWRPSPPGSVTVLAAEDGLGSDRVTALARDSSGALWVGTRQGLVAVVDGAVRPGPRGPDGTPPGGVHSLYPDGGGTVWLSAAAGLGRIRGGELHLYGAESGLDLGDIHAVVPDTLGNLWLSTNDGLHQVRIADLDALDAGRIEAVPYRTFGRPDGLRSAEANGGVDPAGIRSRSGSIWFPTMEGAVEVDPAEVSSRPPAPTPVLEQLALGDSVLRLDGPVSLPGGSRAFDVHFTAPTMVGAHDLEFRYRLEGLQEGWVEAGARRVAYFTNVPPGDYRFDVQARRPGGEWDRAATSLPLTVAPLFHETWAFRGLVLLGLLLLAAAGYQLRVRALKGREAELLGLVRERERAQEALRSSEERLRLALGVGRMITWELELGAGRVSLPPEAASQLGARSMSVEELLRALEPFLSAADHRRLAEIPRRFTEGAEEVHLDGRVTLGDASRHVELRGRAFDRGPRSGRVIGVVADVTELMEAQEKLRRRDEQLRQAQKMEAVGKLAGGVAHDFNNLLTAISGHTQVALEAVPEDDPIRGDLEEIRAVGQRAARLTQQLLTFSRRRLFQPQLLSLNELIRSLERMLRRLVREDVTLDMRLDPQLAGVEVDHGGMEKILVNLVVNAQDAMPQGGRILVRTWNDGGDVVLSVQDEGHGMDEETREQLFDPFFTTKPPGRGTGLGLSTVYGIVQDSDGSIEVDSSPGEGAEFRIRLPARTGTPAELPARASEGDLPGGTETVLLVEDDDTVRRVTRRILERQGYTVHDAASPRAALAALDAGLDAPDLLVSDVVLPDMGGGALAEEVRTRSPDVAVLLVSGYNEDEVLRQGVRAGEVPFLQKPYQMGDLIRKVREVLDARTAR